MIYFINRLKNLWAWSKYHPVTNPPDETILTGTGSKKSQFIEPITDKERWDNAENISDLLN